MSQRMLFVGAGAIGSYLGGFLSRASHDVTLVDPWPEHVEAVRANGLDLTGPHEPFTTDVNIRHLHEAQKLRAEFDVLFMAVKSYDTEWATHFGLRFLKPDGYVVAAQNCWNDPVIASIAGEGRAVGLIMSRISVAMWEPGRVERGVDSGASTGHVVFRAGEHDGRTTDRVKALVDGLSVIDGAMTTDNLWGERWAKLCQNSMGNPVHALSGLGASEVAGLAEGRRLSIALARESAQVGLGLGLKVPNFGGAPAETWANSSPGDVFEELDSRLAESANSDRNWRSSMAQDVIKGRRTEIDYMNGYVVARGAEVDVPTPVSQKVVEVVRQIDSGARAPSPASIDEILSTAGL